MLPYICKNLKRQKFVWAGTTMKNPLPAFIVGFGVWMLFLYRLGRNKKG